MTGQAAAILIFIFIVGLFFSIPKRKCKNVYTRAKAKCDICNHEWTVSFVRPEDEPLEAPKMKCPNCQHFVHVDLVSI